MNCLCSYFYAALVIALGWASACIAADIPSVERPLKVLDLVPNQNWEKEKNNTRAGKYFEKAQELKKLGKYTDANYFFELSLQLEPEFKLSVEREQAEIFLRTGRKADAERLMRKVVNSRQRDDQIVESYVNLLIEQHKAAEAVQLCHRLSRLDDREYHWLLLCTALRANGQKSKAIELAKVSCIRLAREEKSYSAFKNFLDQNGVKFKLPYSNSRNRAVLSIVKRISNLNTPATDAQLAAIFPSKDKEKAWLSHTLGAKCVVCRFTPCQVLLRDEEPNSSLIKIYPDWENTCITRAEVEKLFGKRDMKPATWAAHGNGRPGRLEYFDIDPRLQFSFSPRKDSSQRGFDDRNQHVTEVQISWRSGQISQPPTTPYVPPKPMPDDEIEAHIQDAEKAFKDGDFRRAATVTMKYFQDGHNVQRAGYERYLSRKKLLANCYRKLDRDDIADVVDTADYATLSFYVEQAYGYKTLLLPTMDEYLRERWKATGSYDGGISLHSPGWLITGVEKDNPHYSEFVKLVGRLKDGEERLVPPIPARLIDPTLFDPKVSD